MSQILQAKKDKKIGGCKKNYSYPYRTINGRKDREHRHVMEQELGRPLMPHEHVYRKNNDPFDNRIENLVIINKRIYK